jgi:hypothetical protein
MASPTIQQDWGRPSQQNSIELEDIQLMQQHCQLYDSTDVRKTLIRIRGVKYQNENSIEPPCLDADLMKRTKILNVSQL